MRTGNAASSASHVRLEWFHLSRNVRCPSVCLGGRKGSRACLEVGKHSFAKKDPPGKANKPCKEVEEDEADAPEDKHDKRQPADVGAHLLQGRVEIKGLEDGKTERLDDRQVWRTCLP